MKKLLLLTTALLGLNAANAVDVTPLLGEFTNEYSMEYMDAASYT